MGNWKIWIGVACWILRCNGNSEIFDNERPRDDAVLDISRRVPEILYSPAILQESGLMKNGMGDLKEIWEAPEVGWFKLNSVGGCGNGGFRTACGDCYEILQMSGSLAI